MSAAGQSPRRTVIALAAVLAVYAVHTLYLNVVGDDAFITFRYARNLVLGHGWVWNVGEAPVEGFTSVLWVAVCALALRLGLDVVLAAQVLGALAGLATIGLTYAFARRRLGMDATLALLPCAILATSGPFCAWAGSAMETNLFGLLVLAAAYAFTGEGWDGAGGTIAVAGLLVLATLTRPEGFGIFGLLLGVLVLARVLPWTGRRPDGRRELLLAGAYLVPFAAFIAWRYATFGELVPNTFHAKTGLSPFILLRGALYTGYFVAFFIGPWIPLFLVAWRRHRAGAPGLPGPGEGRFARVVGAALLLGYGGYVVAVGGDYMAMYRFFVPILPLVALAIGLVAARVAGDRAADPAGRRLAIAVLAVGFALSLVHSTPLDVVLFGRPRAQQGHHAGIVNERYAVTRFAAVGRYFDARKRSPEEVLATRVIGAMGWQADMRILDMFGLTDPHIARFGRSEKPLGLGFPGHERTDLPYIARRRPTFIFLALDDAPRRVSVPDWGAEANEILNQEYVVREARVDIPGQGEGWLYFLERTVDRPGD